MISFLLMQEARMPLIKRQSREQFRLHGSIWLHVRTENQEMRIGDASLIQSRLSERLGRKVGLDPNKEIVIICSSSEWLGRRWTYCMGN